MISIIVPVYNAEKYLDHSIQSILSQTYTDFELLLIDDGSTDSSGAICDKYAEQDFRIRVFHKENGGVSSARNMGLGNIRGDYFTFIDADDTVNVNYLRSLAPCEDEDFVMGSSDMRSAPLLPGLYSGEDMIRRIFSDWHIIAIMDKLYKRDVVDVHKIRFEEILNYGEDTVFNLKYLLYVDKCRLSSTVEYNYNVTVEGSLSKKRVSFEKAKMKALEVYEIGKKFSKKYANPEIELWISKYAGITWAMWHDLAKTPIYNRIRCIKQLFQTPETMALMTNYLKCAESGKKYALFYWLGRLRLYRIAASIIP